MDAISHTQFKKTLLNDPKTAAAYGDLAEEYRLIREMLRAYHHTLSSPLQAGL